MNINQVKEEVKEVSDYLWDRLWCERNGGNISVRLDEDSAGSDTDRLVLMEAPKAAAGMAFFITQTGGRLRELRNKFDEVSAIVQFNDDATGYYVRKSDRADFTATSEFITHVLVHLDLVERKSESRCVVHCHPHELIVLSHHPELGKDEDAFNFACMSMLPEVRAFVPNGMALAPYFLPGSRGLADLTVEGFRSRDVVIWSKHGAIACGATLLEAFDYLDVANKGADLYLKCLAAGYEPVGMSEAEMGELETVFNLPACKK